jgi:hypothetical protein
MRDAMWAKGSAELHRKAARVVSTEVVRDLATASTEASPRTKKPFVERAVRERKDELAWCHPRVPLSFAVAACATVAWNSALGRAHAPPGVG